MYWFALVACSFVICLLRLVVLVDVFKDCLLIVLDIVILACIFVGWFDCYLVVWFGYFVVCLLLDLLAGGGSFSGLVTWCGLAG